MDEKTDRVDELPSNRKLLAAVLLFGLGHFLLGGGLDGVDVDRSVVDTAAAIAHQDK